MAIGSWLPCNSTWRCSSVSWFQGVLSSKPKASPTLNSSEK
jgi:hypothetical protein